MAVPATSVSLPIARVELPDPFSDAFFPVAFEFAVTKDVFLVSAAAPPFFALLSVFFCFASSGSLLVLTLVESLCFRAPDTSRELMLDMENGSRLVVVNLG